MIGAFNAILPMAGFSVIIMSGDGLGTAIVQSMYYPAYCVLIMLCWSLLGEQFTDSVSTGHLGASI